MPKKSAKKSTPQLIFRPSASVTARPDFPPKLFQRRVLFLKNFLNDEDGQAVFEYIFLLSLVLVGANALTRAVIGAIDRSILGFGGKLEQFLKTGRAPASVWTN